MDFMVLIVIYVQEEEPSLPLPSISSVLSKKFVIMDIYHLETVLAALPFMEMIVMKDHVHLGLKEFSTQHPFCMNARLLIQDYIFRQMKPPVRNVQLAHIKTLQARQSAFLVMLDGLPLSAGSEDYEPCLSGTFSSSNGSTICQSRPSSLGETTSSIGSSCCDSCISGWYCWDDWDRDCHFCLLGADCSSSSTLQTLVLTEDKWRSHSTSLVVENCVFSGACSGGNGTRDALCNVGFEGPLCAVCSKDHYYDKAKNGCQDCSQTGESISTLIVLVIMSMTLILLVKIIFFPSFENSKGFGMIDKLSSLSISKDVIVEKEEAKENEEESQWKKSLKVKAKIIFTFFQIVSSFMWVLSLDFPENFISFISSLGFINLDFVEAPPLGCYMENNYIRQLVIMTLTSILLSLLLFVASKIYEHVKPEHKEEIITHYFSFFLTLTFLVFPSVSGKIFRTFSCDKLDDGNFYLRADYSIDYESDEHSFGRYWAMFMIFIYHVIITLLYFCLLYSKRGEINPKIDEKGESKKLEELKLKMREDNASLVSFTFSFDVYEPEM